MLSRFRTFRNSEPVREAEIPRLPLPALAEAVVEACGKKGRLVLWFGRRVEGKVRVYAVVADDAAGRLGVLASEDIVEGTSYPAMTPSIAQADRAERELHEQMGIVPAGHPWLKGVRYPTPKAILSPDRVLGQPTEHTLPGAYPFLQVEGAPIHEVGVGPIHAGIIGPGYFRFECLGEVIEHLEIQLGYEHRGAEELVPKVKPSRAPIVVETIAGDTCIGYATAYSQLHEGLAGCTISPRAAAIRGISLEVERLANHVGDLGALAGDVAYWPSAAYFGRIRGEFLNTAMEMGGNRYGKHYVRPGGTARDITPKLQEKLLDRFRKAKVDLTVCIEQMFDAGSVNNRFETTAPVSYRQAVDFGFVGPIARASGVAIDVRQDHPTGIWQFAHIPIAQSEAGAVQDRAVIRRLEIERSIDFLIELMERLPEGSHRVPSGAPTLGDFAVSLVEGWRGEIALAFIYNEDGSIARFKAQDPSFRNWNAMQLANRKNQISDFPVCNKSCNLAYNGHDL